jgi:predicted small metal-binding protein
MKVAECPCGWKYKAKSEEEIVREVQKHGKEAHGKTIKKEEVLSKVRDEK